MPALSPSALRRDRRKAALLRNPEARPCYAQRRIVATVEVRFSLPPSTNSLFANVAGGRIKTPRYRAWRAKAALEIATSTPRPGRIAGAADVAIFMPPFRGDVDNRIKPCLDALVEAGIIAGDSQKYVRNVQAYPGAEATLIRMVLTSIPVDEDDAIGIEVRAREGQDAKYIAVALGLSVGQVETVLARARAR